MLRNYLKEIKNIACGKLRHITYPAIIHHFRQKSKATLNLRCITLHNRSGEKIV